MVKHFVVFLGHKTNLATTINRPFATATFTVQAFPFDSPGWVAQFGWPIVIGTKKAWGLLPPGSMEAKDGCERKAEEKTQCRSTQVKH